MILSYAIILKFFISIFICIFIFFIKDKIISILNIYDNPGIRKIHKIRTSLAGGTIILFYMLNYLVICNFIKEDDLLNEFYIFSNNNFILLCIISFFIYFIGLVDDKFKVSNFKRLFILSALITILCYQDPSLFILNYKLSFGWNFEVYRISKILIFLLIIIFVISMNLFDGINLQSGIFYFLNFLFLSLYTSNINYIFIFCIPILLFMYFNFKNKCFLGDSGSNLLSFLLIYFFLKFYQHDQKINFDQLSLVAFLPIVDAFRLFIYRIWTKGKPFEADMNHFHHIILNKFEYKYFLVIILFFVLTPNIFIYFNVNGIYTFFVLMFSYIYLIKNTSNISRE